MTQMIELVDKDIKICITHIVMFNVLYVQQIRGKVEHVEIWKIFFERQLELLKMKTTISEMKNTLDGIN